MGLRGSPGGLRGEIEIFPGPLAKRIIKLLIVLYLTPSVSPSVCRLPGRGAFWFTANQKLSPQAGKVAWRSHDERGTAQSCPAVLLFPSVGLRRQLPHKWWRLLVQYKHGVQCRTPSRSDRFNGVTGGAGGPKGRNRNLPWPPCKKGYKETPFSFVYLNP